MFLLKPHHKTNTANVFDTSLSLIDRLRCDLKKVIENNGIKVTRINICLKDECLDIKVEIDSFTSKIAHQ